MAGDEAANLLSKFAIELVDVEVRQQQHVHPFARGQGSTMGMTCSR